MTHRWELRHFGVFLGLCAVLAGCTYLLPQAASLRPWISGEPIPLAHLVLPERRKVQEDAWGDVVATGTAPVAPLAPLPPEDPASRLPVREPAVPTAVEHPEALAHWFSALAAAEAGEPGRVVRALHWGDSTIAADGITGRLRERLQARFGDGGPGYLPVFVDPRWQMRPGIMRVTKGEWTSHDLTFGGAAERRYGLGGIVSTITGEGTASFGGLKIDDERQPLHRFQVYYQLQPEGGTLSMAPRGVPGASVRTSAAGVVDAVKDLEAPEGAPWLWLKAHGDGPVTVYGVALETTGPGMTWECLGVAGSSIGSSLAHQGTAHLREQVRARAPDLLVYQTGGNELDRINHAPDDFREAYLKVLRRLQEGAPEASCLLVSPLDQAIRARGQVVSKPALTAMIELQRQVAAEAGCAFWDARHVMGGEGGFTRWLEHSPRYAWTDLMHLTTKGFDLVGDSLADALIDAYEHWEPAGGGGQPSAGPEE
ncbi:MAG: GDSL-type esterase/lipase family protein [Pseudomonadota bacterium]